MSLRSIISAALRSAFRFVVVTSEFFVNGVRQVVSMLVPARNTGMADQVDDIIAEDDSAEALAALAAARSARMNARPSEPERIRSAAVELREGRPISASLLDPKKAAEAEVLEWLAQRDQLHLGMIARASDDDISCHLDGERRLRMPLLPAAEADYQERLEAMRPQSVVGWMRELTKIAAETGDDDPDFEAMLLKAQSMADAGCTLADYRSQTLAEAVEEASVIDDREDVG